MKIKLLLFLLFLFSFAGYLEWGNGQTEFVLVTEFKVLKSLFTNPSEVVHPLTLIPLAGQLILLLSLFLKHPGKWIIYIGGSAIAILYIIIFTAGVLSLNYKMILSSFPFVLTFFYAIIKKGTWSI